VLIAGDTLWGGWHPKVKSDIEAWERSLEKLARLDFDALTFGHCPPNLYFDANTIVQEAAAAGRLFHALVQAFLQEIPALDIMRLCGGGHDHGLVGRN
jgi:glyoxylase-like metal-dependent hydrolase (beta-lactamase superfamily II)